MIEKIYVNSINEGVIVTDGTTIFGEANTTYYCLAASAVNFVLPAANTTPDGSIITIMQAGAGIITINYGTGQQIRVGSALSTATTGHIGTTQEGDAISLFTPDGTFYQAIHYIGAITVA